MVELVQLDQVRRKKAADRAFSLWPRRLGFAPASESALGDLPDNVIMALADLGPKATLALYDLVLGVRNLGPGERFHYLRGQAKVEALDAFLFLADQVRFELMRRLGWVRHLPGEVYPLLDLALEPRLIRRTFSPPCPEICPAYHGYQGLIRQFKVEPKAVLGSLIPEALEAFRSRLRMD